MQLGLDRDVSDEEDDEDADEQSFYVYTTEEDDEIDELNKEYLEHLQLAAAESADPFEGEAPGSGKTRLTHNGGGNPSHLSHHQEGQKYD